MAVDPTASAPGSVDVYPVRRWRIERSPDIVRVHFLRHRPAREWVGTIITGIFVLIGGLLFGLSPGETSEDREILRSVGLGALAIGLAGMASIEVKARKSWRIDVTGERLTVTGRGVFGSSIRAWAIAKVESVKAERVFYQGEDASTGTMALVVTFQDGKRDELLRYYDSGGNLAMVAGILSRTVADRCGISSGDAALRGPGAQCPVCSQAMNASILYCGTCRTPHHQECWTYNGQCAIYGCRGIKPSPASPS